MFSVRCSFCKNSVFCALFLFLFTMGTICGSYLLRCILRSDAGWMLSYCNLIQSGSVSKVILGVWFLLLPFLSVLCIYFFPGKDKLVLVLVFIRGCIVAYTLGAFYTMGVSLSGVLLRTLLLLPLFYWVCRKVWVTAPI